jgi:hypothetical protein
MSSADTDARIEELSGRIAVLKAAIETGATASRAPASKSDFPFLASLQGEDLIAARTLIEENAALRARVKALESIIGDRDYRILHLKQNVERLIP